MPELRAIVYVVLYGYIYDYYSRRRELGFVGIVIDILMEGEDKSPGTRYTEGIMECENAISNI